MSKNKIARSRAGQHIKNLPNFTDAQLVELCKILQADTRRRIKGGEWKQYSSEDLQKSIRSVIGRGTFADMLMRFVDKADEFRSRHITTQFKPTCKRRRRLNCGNLE